MSEIISFAREDIVFVGRAVKDLAAGELERINPERVVHLDVANDVYLGYYAVVVPGGNSLEHEVRRLAEVFAQSGVRAKVYILHTTVSVVESKTLS